MTVAARRLIDQLSEVVALALVVFDVLVGFADLLLQASDCGGGFSFFFLPPRSESSRSTGVALSLLISHFRRSLHIHWNLYMTLVCLECEQLIIALTSRGNRDSIGAVGLLR